MTMKSLKDHIFNFTLQTYLQSEAQKRAVKTRRRALIVFKYDSSFKRNWI